MPLGTRCFNMLSLVSRDLSSTPMCMYVQILHSWDEIHIFEDVGAVGTRVFKFWSYCIQSGMLQRTMLKRTVVQRTVFVNKIRMLERTRRNTNYYVKSDYSFH